MSSFVRKTFDNSYLFNLEANKQQKALVDFIITSDRIDKSNPAFKGIIEDVKRMQNTSILYSILMNNNVVLCIGKNGALPRTFKVFEAKDLRTDKQPKVFIDVTEIVKFKDGYFICNKIDTLITYLFSALNYLLYSKATLKILGNSNISICATECYVSMFTYVMDYLRIIGYSQNKEKISYLVGLFFLNNMMSKDLDTYTKNIAAKVAGISNNDVRPYELYYDAEKDFVSIDSFIKLISETFKLKGFTTEVFVHQWMYSFGTGTQFGSELFTSFLNIVSSAYCGTYIVNQKQIERCCGNSMVKLCKAIIQLGVEEFDRRGFMSESEFDATIPRDKNIDALKETVANNKIDKSKEVLIALGARCRAMNEYVENGSEYRLDSISKLLKESSGDLNEKDKRFVYNKLRSISEDYMDKARENREDKELSKRYAECSLELRKCYNF